MLEDVSATYYTEGVVFSLTRNKIKYYVSYAGESPRLPILPQELEPRVVEALSKGGLVSFTKCGVTSYMCERRETLPNVNGSFLGSICVDPLPCGQITITTFVDNFATSEVVNDISDCIDLFINFHYDAMEVNYG